jgi:hypothetical protein
MAKIALVNGGSGGIGRAISGSTSERLLCTGCALLRERRTRRLPQRLIHSPQIFD